MLELSVRIHGFKRISEAFIYRLIENHILAEFSIPYVVGNFKQ